MKTVTLTNSFHNTNYELRAVVGQNISKATVRRIWKTLCGISECQCCDEDGTRDSRYRLLRQSFEPDSQYVLADLMADLVKGQHGSH